MAEMLSWEQAVQWLRQQPEQQMLVRDCYFDDPLLDAAQRFAESAEWLATRSLWPRPVGAVLDLGAGRGISSYALACDGWQVTALEPDPSLLVGAGAIRQLAAETGLPVQVIEEYGEELPFPNDSFDLVYGRQVLHHARDLNRLCHEAARVLKSGGRLVATREHVISSRTDLGKFLDAHPLQKFYGGENAFLLDEYRLAFAHAGLRLLKTIGPLESAVNYYPLTEVEWRAECRRPLIQRLGLPATNLLTDERHAVGRWLLPLLASVISRRAHTPGRLYSFVAVKRL